MKLTLKGIETYLSAARSQGSAQDVVNLRNKYGEWNIAQEASDLYQLLPAKWIVHDIPDSAEVYYWAFDGVGSIFYVLKGDDYSNPSVFVEKLKLNDDETFSHLQPFGRYMMVFTDKRKYTYVLKNIVGTAPYTEYERLKDLPEITFSVGTTDRNDAHGIQEDIHADSWWSRAQAKLHELIKEQTDEGRIQGHTFIRLAYMTIDGDYIIPSAPQYKYIGSIQPSEIVSPLDEWGTANAFKINASKNMSPIMFYDGTDNGSTSGWYGTNRIYLPGKWAKPIIKLSINQSIWDNYEGIISGIAIFISKPISDYDYTLFSEVKTYIQDPNQHEYNSFMKVGLNNKDLDTKDAFELTNAFYKVKEISLEEMKTETEFTVDVKDIEAGEVLIPSVSHALTCQNSYEYNSRLHMANITSQLIDCPSLSINDEEDTYMYSSGYSDLNLTSEGIYAVAVLNISGSNKVVITPYGDVATFTSGFNTHWYQSPLLSYPDSRAVSIQFVLFDAGGYKRLTDPVTLKPHPVFNISYSMVDLYEYTEVAEFIQLSVVRINFQDTKFRIHHYRSSQILIGTDTNSVDDRYYQDKNRVQVSELLQPLVNLTKHSYRFGIQSNAVLALQANTISLSTGQFGQFPLLVFSEQGVFSLVKGDGVLYASIVPVSTDRMVNDEVVPTPVGIAFISEKGISLQYGAENIILSTLIDGFPINYLAGNTYFQNLVDGSYDLGVTEDSLIDNIDFSTAVMGFDAINSELHISIPTKYTLIYNTHSKIWYKIKQYWSAYIVEGGHLIGITSEGMFQDVNTPKNENVSFLLITNPFTIDNSMLKKHLNIYLNFIGSKKDGNINPPPPPNPKGSDNLVGIHLYGSANLGEWKLIGGKRFRQLRKLELKKVRASARYFVIQITGNLNKATFSDINLDIIQTD